jgi:hypothetical protein
MERMLLARGLLAVQFGDLSGSLWVATSVIDQIVRVCRHVRDNSEHDWPTSSVEPHHPHFRSDDVRMICADDSSYLRGAGSGMSRYSLEILVLRNSYLGGNVFADWRHLTYSHYLYIHLFTYLVTRIISYLVLQSLSFGISQFASPEQALSYDLGRG